MQAELSLPSAALLTASGRRKRGTGERKRKSRSQRGTGGRNLPSPSDQNFTLLLGEQGEHQVAVVVLRHQGINGKHPTRVGYYYYQARVRNVYPQKHLWAGWATKDDVSQLVTEMFIKKMGDISRITEVARNAKWPTEVVEDPPDSSNTNLLSLIHAAEIQDMSNEISEDPKNYNDIVVVDADINISASDKL